MSARAGTTDWAARFGELWPREPTLSAHELDELGLAAWFLGREAECEAVWDHAFRVYQGAGEVDAAARCAFWLTFTLAEHGHAVKAGAWMVRLEELCGSEAGRSSPVAAAIAALGAALGAWASGDAEASVALGEDAVRRARAAGELDIEALATMVLARALVGTGRGDEGFRCMDRLMLLIESGEVSDRAAGPAYCAVIAACLERWDLDRATVWTQELSDWCDAQRGLEPFRGECSVHRATVLSIGGEWEEAERTLAEVLVRERRPQTLENALYRLGELHRLTGRTDAAETAYRQAAGLGRDVQPGLALLRRDGGRSGAARAAVTRALEGGPPPGACAELLAVSVDLQAERGDVEQAQAAEAALRALADHLGTRYLRALADRASGTVLLAAGEPDRALPLLRRSWSAWRELEDPYDGALTRILLGRAARALDDEEGAQLEFDAARTALGALGAIPDLARLEKIAATAPARGAAAGLSPREVDVVRLVCLGLSNREIAARLFLSERTVARHVGNILAKLALPNRAAVTAFAFEQGIVTPR